MGETQGPPAKGKQSHSVGTFSQPRTHVGWPPGWLQLGFPHATSISCCSTAEHADPSVAPVPSGGKGLWKRGQLRAAQQKHEPGPGLTDIWKHGSDQNFRVEPGEIAPWVRALGEQAQGLEFKF